MTRFASPPKAAPLFAMLALAGALCASPALAQTASLNTSPAGTLSLVGEGRITGTPDVAVIRTGVVTLGKTARDALTANTAAMEKLFALLHQSGIKYEDIQTSDFSVQPQYDYSNQRNSDGYTPPPRIAGYQVSNNVAVKIRETETLGKILDQLVSAGSNQINSVSFSLADPAPLLAEARRAAMADAIAKARLYADAAGVQLGNIISITEGNPTPPPLPQPDMIVARMAAEAAPVPVAAGTMETVRQVSVVWQLIQK